MKVHFPLRIGVALVLLAGAALPASADHWQPNCPHSSPHAHAYVLGGSVGGKSDAATRGDEIGAGYTTVTDGNTLDCDGGGTPGDFDGDYEIGVGGGFFGYGYWRHELGCDFGLTNHGATVTVNDAVFGGAVAFVVGADDMNGPGPGCTTDGVISPCGGPVSPVCDPDDCISPVYVGSGATCGAGGDGGYWVFLSGVDVVEAGGLVGVSNPPTTGTLTA